MDRLGLLESIAPPTRMLMIEARKARITLIIVPIRLAVASIINRNRYKTETSSSN